MFGFEDEKGQVCASNAKHGVVDKRSTHFAHLRDLGVIHRRRSCAHAAEGRGSTLPLAPSQRATKAGSQAVRQKNGLNPEAPHAPPLFVLGRVIRSINLLKRWADAFECQSKSSAPTGNVAGAPTPFKSPSAGNVRQSAPRNRRGELKRRCLRIFCARSRELASCVPCVRIRNAVFGAERCCGHLAATRQASFPFPARESTVPFLPHITRAST